MFVSSSPKRKNMYLFHFYLQSDDGWEEVFDFVFPEDESRKPNLKIMAAVQDWLKEKEE